MMIVTPKTPEEIQKMRVAGRLAAQVLEMIEAHVQPGISTEKLNQICHDYIVNVQGAIPAPLNYKGFPKSICTSVNHVICHGIPSPDKMLKEGDIIGIDVTVIKDGYHGDTCKTYFVGKPSIIAQRLVQTTQDCLYDAIATVKAGSRLGDIGKAIQIRAHRERFSIVEEYCGHGIGRIFHEPSPTVLHYASKDPEQNMILEEGMTFTIEPMINVGKKHTKLLPDHWTVITQDRSLSAQWEHTLAVTKTGVEVLTMRQEEQARLAQTPNIFIP